MNPQFEKLMNKIEFTYRALIKMANLQEDYECFYIEKYVEKRIGDVQDYDNFKNIMEFVEMKFDIDFMDEDFYD